MASSRLSRHNPNDNLAKACNSMRGWLFNDHNPAPTVPPGVATAGGRGPTRHESHPGGPSNVGTTLLSTPPLQEEHKSNSSGKHSSVPTHHSNTSAKVMTTKLETPVAFAGHDTGFVIHSDDPNNKWGKPLDYELARQQLEEEEKQKAADLRDFYAQKRAALKVQDITLPQKTVAISPKKENAQEPVPITLEFIQKTIPQDEFLQKEKRSADSWSVSDLDPSTNINSQSVKLVEKLPEIRRPVSRKDHRATFNTTLLSGKGKEGSISHTWLDSLELPEPVTLPKDSNGLEYRRFDIDTITGNMIAPPEYPETLQCYIEGACRDARDIGWRRCNMTSELQITRELASRQKLGMQVRDSIAQVQADTRVASDAAAEDHQWPNAHCVVRPACPADFQQIADIINLETQSGSLHVLDSKQVSAADINKVFTYCQHHKRPFIVAVPAEDELLDPAKWPKSSGKAYQEYLEFKKSQPVRTPPVVGFGFISEAFRVGLLNAPCPGMRFSGQARIVVHPKHRRQLYGSALLDKLLSCICFRRSFVDYEWKCAESGHIYDTSHTSNVRQYTRLYIEVLCEGREDAGLKWRDAMLSKYGFTEAAHLRRFVRTDRGPESKWIDVVLYEFEAQKSLEVCDRRPGEYLLPQP
ncbi:Acyl-CoA N-acyltransferase [Purpureocillium lilacinum]|uniref:Acyl-CoA N-acyltransferase n=1 Tax=Purpureocillium lilacinum TaxID=33203 RepID=A0A179HJ33_PURLI|nr:Acyl-CoA N-acyltransferase [Purpureocillium lilacinum]OAQ89423.1 Acyl-CoA N-acyltransferase [Purpureocillium lilacinum]